MNSSVFNEMSKNLNQVYLYQCQYCRRRAHFIALQLPRLFAPPHSHLQNISSDLHELRKWSWAARGEQLLHLLHTSYATDRHDAQASSARRRSPTKTGHVTFVL